MVTAGSIDEAIMRKADEKRRFADSSITGEYVCTWMAKAPVVNVLQLYVSVHDVVL